MTYNYIIPQLFLTLLHKGVIYSGTARVDQKVFNEKILKRRVISTIKWNFPSLQSHILTRSMCCFFCMHHTLCNNFGTFTIKARNLDISTFAAIRPPLLADYSYQKE